MPICHCGGSDILRGLIRSFYKAVIQRCEAPKYLVNKRSFAIAQLCIQAHTSSLRCGGSLCKDDNVASLCKDDMRRHCEELATKQSTRLKRILQDCFVVSDYSGCSRSNVRLQLTGWGTSCHGALPKIRARNDEKYLLSTPLPKIRPQNDKKKAAFTLAEVLITLGVIGIVAAMTMPMIVENTKKQQTVVQLKKSYSILSQAVALSELENGSCDYWDYTLPVDQFVKKYLTKFLEIRETRVSDSGQNYKYLNGSPCAEALCTEASYVISVADGTNFVVSRCYWLDNGRVVLIDINGDKQPNTLGKDVFSFAIQPGVKVSPFGYGTFGLAGAPDIGDGEELSGAQYFGKYDRDVLLGGDTYACSNGNRGFWCAALILSDGWEIRDDYPW